ncbi:phage terminase large subunit [Treponema bryantii]|uniref:Phage terminase large subunit n=1 Tax=Treponema bryantii TaxID=163 RepID=A0A1H9AXB3_9SPIR|nr:PBSX family phage terminase large subunit [Treponema bryantii]SEP80588.1 phage terminase large subunit [Treponema bryantii]
MENERRVVKLSDVVGGGYDEFWNFKGRYRVVKGSRGSKKSCTTALWYIYKMMEFYHKYGLKPNVLVIRKHVYLNKQSTRAQLIWAMEQLGVRHLWKVMKGSYTLTYKPSGQKIYFRGMDDVMGITSIVADEGQLCWVWFEEAYQVNSEADFNKIDMSIRGELPAPLFKQITLTFNPWSDRHWLKKRFFDFKHDDILALTTNYKCNEFLGDDDRALFELMKTQNPRRYRIEGLGDWGVADGLVYDNWEVKEFNIQEVLRQPIKFVSCNGMDFGYNDPTAFVGAYCDTFNKIIYIYYEFYAVTMENSAIARELIAAGFRNAMISGDSEDPRTINELKKLGLVGLHGCRKGSGSVLGGIQKLQDYHIVIHSKNCPNTIEAFSNYCWKRDSKTDCVTNNPEHAFSHIPDALRYGCEDLDRVRMSQGRVIGI